MSPFANKTQYGALPPNINQDTSYSKFHENDDPRPKNPISNEFSVSDSPEVETFPQDAKNGGTRGFNRPSFFLFQWWTFELICSVLSIVCMVAIIIVLAIINGRRLDSWHSTVRPNTVVSVLATASKSLLLLPVAECISQTKWLYYQSGPRPLYDLDVFESASRGPWGALQLLWTTKATALTASLGALITILALGLDPFAQQVITFQSRDTVLQNVTARVPMSRAFDTGNAIEYGPVLPINILVTYPDTGLQGAALSGLYNISTQSPFSCNAPTCSWPSFTTLGVCSSCKDVTQDTSIQCASLHIGTSQNCNYTTPGNFSLNATYIQDAHSIQQVIFNMVGQGFTDAYLENGDLSKPPPSIVDVAMVKLPQYSTVPIPSPAAVYECSLKWCAKTFSSANVVNTTYTASKPTEKEFSSSLQNVVFSNTSTPLEYFVAQLDDNDPQKRNYTINSVDSYFIGYYLQKLFTLGTDNGASVQLYQSSSIPQTMADVATSMTNAIRQGQNGTMFSGTASQSETYIHVRWGWLILPIIIVIAANLFLILLMIETAKHKTPLWKSSSLAILFHGRHLSHERESRIGNLMDMSQRARSMRVKLNKENQQELRLVHL